MLPFVYAFGRVLATWLLLDIFAVLGLVVLSKIIRQVWILRKSMGDTVPALTEDLEDDQFDQSKTSSPLGLSQRLLSPQYGFALESLDHAIDYALNERDLQTSPELWQSYSLSARILIKARKDFLKEHPALAPLRVQFWQRLVGFLRHAGIGVFIGLLPHYRSRM